MHYEGPRRQGRFIKSGSKVMDKVSLVDFSFKDINDAKVITLDNAKRTIIHATYHAPDDLAAGVQSPAWLSDELTTRDHHMRAVIFPLDFTNEWERDKKLRKDRVSRHDDDEEYDYEFEAQRLKEEQEARARVAQGPKSEADAAGMSEGRPAGPAGDGGSAARRAAAAPEAAAGAKTAPLATKLGGGSPTNQWESMDVVGKAIKGLLQTDGDVAPAPADLAGEPRETGPAPGEFIPVTTTAPAGGEPMDPEAAAAGDYRARVERLKAEEAQLQAKLDQIAEEAKAKGYRDGFRMGEEKAELQARQHAAQLFGKVSELITEFGRLKHDVLENVQENFYELCQAMAEALVKREFAIHPETFVTVLRRAIAEAVEPGKFKIRVHPDTYEHIAALGSSDILAAMTRDAEVPPGDFKIESQLSVVDVSVAKMIAELLRQADLNLFTEDKAG